MIELNVLQDSRSFADGIDQSPCNGCDECGARCTAGVPMLRAEFAEIHGYVRSPAGADARRVEQQEKRLPYPGTDGSEGATYTACRFRDVGRGRCSIYPVRPLICRLFGHVDWLPCPIQRITAPVAGGRETMLRYAEAPRKTYEEWLEEPSPVA